MARNYIHRKIGPKECGIFFWAKQEENKTMEEVWNKLVTLEQNSELKEIKQDDSLISKFVTNITDKK